MIRIRPQPCALDRRLFLNGAAAAGLSLALPASAAPADGEVVLAGGRILSMDPALGDFETGDVHIRQGAIVEVARTIPAPGVPRIDMAETVLLPGFVDTHWHMWNTMARGLASTRLGPFGKSMGALVKVWTPEASALGVRLAAAEAIDGGVTTVNNWAHNTAGPEFADAEFDAMAASGMRGRHSYGYPQTLGPDRAMDIAGLEAFHKRRFPADRGGLVSLGACLRGPDRSAEAVWREEWSAVRPMRLPLTAHIASDRAAAAKGSIKTLGRDGLLGPDTLLVHATHASADDFRTMKAAGAPLSLSPWTELEVGYGLPALREIAASGVEIGLSIDNTVLAGRADMFGVMRVTADLASGLAETQGAIGDRRVLEWATIGAARALGIDDAVGSLTPGKRADIIAVRTDRLGLAPVGSVEFLLTHVAQPADVSFVMIDGEIHKRDGRLTRLDAPALVAEARTAMAQLRARAGL